MTGPATWSRPRALALAAASGWAPLDLSQGVPAEPEPALAHVPRPTPAPLAAYPRSAGHDELRATAARYLARRFGVYVPVTAVAACAGAKEFIATVPTLLRAARPDPPARRRDVALIPALGYPPYAFGARLAGLRADRVPVDETGRMDLSAVPDQVARRALYLWVNSPANPTGVVEDLVGVVAWCRRRGIVALSDEAYAELTWTGEPSTALATGLDGVLAVHSVSKRSNSPGQRVGFYAGDPGLVAELVASRRAAGLIAAAASQRAAARLFDDDRHAAALCERNAGRVAGLVRALRANRLPADHPDGGLFAWVAAPGGDGVAFAYRAAARVGLVVTPGVEFGPAGAGHVRFAAAAPAEAVAPRLAALAFGDDPDQDAVRAGRAPAT